MRIGPAINAVNRQIRATVASDARFDLIWIDKAVYLWPETVQYLRERAKSLIHYTPDAAFFQNRSRFFESTLGLYDRLVTTKSFEMDEYRRRCDPGRLTLVPQSYDSHQHRPTVPFEQKRREAVLIGLCEKAREDCISLLLRNEIPVAVGGQGWERFRRLHQDDAKFRFLGARVFGAEYTAAISEASVGLGLVTKRFPELHTTRTFEIPACGTALATEENQETTKFFSPREAVFFKNYDELVQRLSDIFSDEGTLRQLTESGRERVLNGGFDNRSMVLKVLNSAGVTPV